MSREPLKVYLAARFARKDEIARRATQLREAGIEVVGAWFDEKVKSTAHVHNTTPEYSRECAVRDLTDLDTANTVVLFGETPGERHLGGGRFFEFGYARAQNKNLYLVGKPEMVFGYLPDVTIFPDFDLLFAYLTGLNHDRTNGAFSKEIGSGFKPDDLRQALAYYVAEPRDAA